MHCLSISSHTTITALLLFPDADYEQTSTLWKPGLCHDVSYLYVVHAYCFFPYIDPGCCMQATEVFHLNGAGDTPCPRSYYNLPILLVPHVPCSDTFNPHSHIRSTHTHIHTHATSLCPLHAHTSPPTMAVSKLR